MTPESPFLGLKTKLQPSHAAAAVLQLSDGRYVMQLRDPKPEIFYPDHWGCFGGAVDEGETAPQALARELKEELGIEVESGSLVQFSEFSFDFNFASFGVCFRNYYAITLPRCDLSGLVLGEGADFAAFEPERLFALQRVVPYDAFALWMHFSRSRFGAPAGM
jgi:8-oxo-dGTP pyrophosphatase MutT (NUDIX family)